MIRLTKPPGRRSKGLNACFARYGQYNPDRELESPTTFRTGHDEACPSQLNGGSIFTPAPSPIPNPVHPRISPMDADSGIDPPGTNLCKSAQSEDPFSEMNERKNSQTTDKPLVSSFVPSWLRVRHSCSGSDTGGLTHTKPRRTDEIPDS